MAGGATGGYCEIGSCVIATAPITMTNSAITHAKIGRSMKNLAMPVELLIRTWRRWRQRRPAAAGLAVPAGAGGCQGTGFTGVPGGIICSFWKPSTITCSPAFRPSSTTHWLFCAALIFTVRVLTLPSASTTITRVALLGARHGLLRQRDGVAGLRLLEPHAHVQAGQQRRPWGWAPRRAA